MKNKRKNKNRISRFAKLSLLIFVITGILTFISRSSTDAANFLDRIICSPFRRIMARFGELFSFSLFQILLFLIPVATAIIIIITVRKFVSGEGRVRFVADLLAIALLLYSGNSLALGISYNVTPIDERMGIAEVEVTEERLESALSSLVDEITALSAVINYENGVSVSGYNLTDASRKICDSYSAINDQYGFPDVFYSTAKDVGALSILSYLRLGGIYTYYTGEANVNTDYPEFDIYFTAAHELSHQRGVLRENEANFAAYLALSHSDDPYLRYSAALNMFSYVGNALWKTDKDGYYSALERLPDGALSDLRASAAVTEKYGNTFLADISNLVNDLFLKSNGTDGTVTYGRVVTLYISYVNSEITE